MLQQKTLSRRLSASVSRFVRNEQGASAIEYALIVGFIAVALIAVLITLGGDDGLRGMFQSVVDAIPGAGEGS
ncbi:MAG: Flp family type IVb pilin [Nevskiales bacterium]